MIDPTLVFERLFETFDKSSIHPFRNFIARNTGITKWMIAADYCLHDKARPNNAFVFSLIPYDDWFGALRDEIRSALPRDLKRTKTVERTATDFLASDRRFHIAFLLDRDPILFTNGPGSVPLQVARECINKTHQHVIAKERSPESIRRVNLLRQAASANNLNLPLLTDLHLLSWFFPFVTLLLARECVIQTVGWFSDRDSMTTWCERVVWDFARETLYGVAELRGITLPGGVPVIGVPDAEDTMWFDEFVRLSDYIAGLLAAWNFKTNQLPDKYVRLAEDVFAESNNISVLNINLDEGGFQCARLVGAKSVKG
ncbi:MAG: hypothetical protein QOH88_1803 [Verrucomicrobiota bacterium]|jgi:hypothetical protein